MDAEWAPKDTNTHQDHVIAHLVAATVLGYFVLDETLYVLLDIGFIWRVYVDGEMGLLPHAVAISELEVDAEFRKEVTADIDRLVHRGFGVKGLKHILEPPVNCMIKDVRLFERGDDRRLIVEGEEESIAVDTSLTSGAISVVGI